MAKKQKILIIVGPTSSGKSTLAVALARKFNGEIISADSRQVYRGLDIGTGKITKHEMKGIRHHLLDIASPKRVFTAHDFVECARVAIGDIVNRGKLPIIAGGTGFYIDALVGRVMLPNVPTNPTLRARLEKKTAMQLFALLEKKDSRRAKTIDPCNKRRLIRALEIVESLGKVPPLRTRRVLDSTVLWIGLKLSQKELEEKIRARLLARMKQGMVTEGRRLHADGLSYRRMEQLGLEYRALARYLRKEISREQMVEGLNRDIRRYAKHQLTYWKRNGSIRWFEPSHKKALLRYVKNWLR
ncbi:tRNA (adenosine(37)-N6)-dimethylallyltransferase MiaA [Candidatus Kaiserbacteria bacterium RIFCSPHIGHO2_01_FULL_55_17]|uniref:tRNA dimethylallyltransferase n=1 Tax=Candidatus Kaiserbacteria bacterium RIFCSPHIGHO2_01_FULL_55_17 TaxID=1798484 RepID=A0A1F6D9L1_9BACT|nr:MAG: tRNA (adenosine(37)-N6)-dimethylallyltransferase MiaA [Candidatus Kaiserbacteria bacterium RIFCSPHIGHO2_01_FULL_55_17]